MAGPAKPPPRLDPGKTGLRKRGQKTGGPHLTVGQTEVVEAYWSASSADLVQLTRDGTPVGDPDRATDQSLPLPHGLAAGDYTFKLVPGVLGGEKPVWSGDAGVDLKLTVKETVLVNKFWITPEPADGHADLAHALQLRNGTKVKLHWSTTGAKKVAILTSTGEFFELDAGPGGAGEFLHDPKDQPGKYKLRALNGEAQSRPATPISIFFHPARMTMSPLTSVVVSDRRATRTRSPASTIGLPSIGPR